jgi:hypothetical protein
MVEHGCHISLLAVDVIEFQHYWVLFSTIHTRFVSQINQQFFLYLASQSLSLRFAFGFPNFQVCGLGGFVRKSFAELTVGLKSAFLDISVVEFRLVFW